MNCDFFIPVCWCFKVRDYLYLKLASFRGRLQFNTNGSFDWVKQSTQPVTGELRKPDIDAAGNIYLAGRTYSGDNFGGVAINNPKPYYPIPLIFKLDANGNTVWHKEAAIASAYGQAISLLSNGEVVLGGMWGDVFKWTVGGDSLVHPIGINYGTDLFITRFNAATGAYIKMDTLGSGPGSSDDEEITVMVSDRKGNLVVGGMFAVKLKVAGTNIQAVSGGFRDMFIAKYGYANCSCVVPTSAFAYTTTAVRTVQYTYSGTTTAIDSLVWNFGDGQKQKVTTGYTTPVSHTYATNGNYSSCATVYSGCGSNQYCKQVALAVGNISALEGVKVYPNPVSDHLMIEGLQGGTYTVMNAIGQQAAAGLIHNSVEKST